jgi:hypothetical protein
MAMSRPQFGIVFHTTVLVGALVSNLVFVDASASSAHARSVLSLQESTAGQDQSDVYISEMIHAGPPSESDSMNFLMRTLNKFKAFAKESRAGVEERHKAEEERLQAGLTQSKDQGTMLALQQSVTSNAESLLETRRVYNNMVNFADSMENFLEKATSKGSGCESTQCGPHASCTDTTLGAQCVCNEGYVGTGKDCAAPPEFMPHHLLFEGKGTQQTKARDMNVAIFGKNTIAVVFADMSRGGMGRTVVGNVREAGMAMMAPPEAFTVPGSQAFNPVVIGTEDKRILIQWRDQNTKGLCWMRAAAMGTTSIRGAEQHLAWGEPVNFCRSQSHKMAAFPMPGNRVVVLFADLVKASQHTPAEAFGNSMLLEVDNKGGITTMGNFRFADFAVCRLEVTKLTPKTFVIAARGAPMVDEMDSAVHTNQEAMALFGEMSGDDLVFDPNPVNLEPKGTDIWARGVSLIAPNTFAYAYQRGKESKIMMGVVHVNETTHRMDVLHQPSEIKAGFSPYVSMLSVPYTASDPHTLIYYDGPLNSMINVCSWDPAKRNLKKCEDFTWVQGKVKSVSGVHLGGGKSFMVFAPESGVPYYGVFGLSKK